MKKAFISGSTKGIGKRMGIDLLNKGYFVYFNGHTQESTKQLEQELNNLNYATNSNIICTDLSILEKNLELANYLKSQCIYLDILILNLGITDRAPFGAICYDSWKKVMDTNLNFPFFLVQSLSSHIKENGKIIFISSISGYTTDSVSISYGVSKGAIHILVPYLAKEFAEKKITVNAVACGYIDTDWHQNKNKEQIKRIEQKHLLKRLGTTQEVSKAVMAIIDNNFINASILKVDGGFLV